MGRGVGDGSMRNLDGSATTTDQGVMGFVDVATTIFSVSRARSVIISEARAVNTRI
jgi:hypothetical protein